MSSDARLTPFAFSPKFNRVMEALAELDRSNRRAGADVRIEAYRLTEDWPHLRHWLENSDRLVDELPGSRRLRVRRRRGILRHMDGPERGLPFFEPLMYPTSSAPEPRAKPLKDELEYLVIPGRNDAGRWRPVKDELTFDEARAIAMMKAGTLYRLTWREGAVPGCIRRRLDDKRSHTAELRFDTEELVGWAVVSKTFFEKK